MPKALSDQRRERLFFTWVGRPSVSHVARVCGVDRITVRKYKELDQWVEKLAALQSGMMQGALGGVEEYRQECLRIVQAMLGDFLERVENNEVKIENPKDFIRVAELGLTLRGEATEIRQVDVFGGPPIEGGRLVEANVDAEKLEERIALQERRLAGLKRRGVIDAEFRVQDEQPGLGSPIVKGDGKAIRAGYCWACEVRTTGEPLHGDAHRPMDCPKRPKAAETAVGVPGGPERQGDNGKAIVSDSEGPER